MKPKIYEIICDRDGTEEVLISTTNEILCGRCGSITRVVKEENIDENDRTDKNRIRYSS